MVTPQHALAIDVRPATWDAFLMVMGERGGCGGCWCMLWRQTKREMDAGMGEGNRLAMKALFDAGHVPGLVAYHGSEAIGWIQVDRRSAFLRLETSRTLQPVYAAEVWSVSCFLIDKRYRLRVLSSRLLRGACAFAKGNGATVLEGYPIDTPKEKYPPVYAWTGFVGAFREAGFQEVVRRTPTRPIMRKTL